MQLLSKLMFSFLSHRWPWPILSLLVRAFGFLAPKNFYLFGFQIFRYRTLPDEDYSRNASCAL